MDIKKKKRKWGGTKGLLSLEASIALTIFLFLMLFLYSFLAVFEARNQVAHVLLTTADSLALDAFANETPEDLTLQKLLFELFGNTAKSEGIYTESDNWYVGDSETIKDAVEARFIGYIAGGDRKEADRILESLNIVDGIDGMNFSNSCVIGDELFLDVRYEIEYEFQVFGMGSIPMTQTCCSKLWK